MGRTKKKEEKSKGNIVGWVGGTDGKKLLI